MVKEKNPKCPKCKVETCRSYGGFTGFYCEWCDINYNDNMEEK